VLLELTTNTLLLLLLPRKLNPPAAWLLLLTALQSCIAGFVRSPHSKLLFIQ